MTGSGPNGVFVKCCKNYNVLSNKFVQNVVKITTFTGNVEDKDKNYKNKQKRRANYATSNYRYQQPFSRTEG